MLNNLTGFHLILIVGVIVLLFGAAKLPMLAKNLGQSAKILKTEMKTMRDEDVPQAAPVPAETVHTAAAPRVAEPLSNS